MIPGQIAVSDPPPASSYIKLIGTGASDQILRTLAHYCRLSRCIAAAFGDLRMA